MTASDRLAPARDWLEGGLATLDPSRKVVALNEALAHWLGRNGGSRQGEPFDRLLEARLTGWEPPLGGLWPDGKTFARCLLCATGPDHRRWFRLEAACNPAGWLVAFNSALPPRSELAEAPGDEYLNTEPERRQMFVRLVRAEAQLENLVSRWPGVIFSQRGDFSFDYVSPGIEGLTGIPVTAWRYQPQRFWEVVYEADVEELKRQCQRAVEKHQMVKTTYRIRHAKTGRVAYVLEHRRAIVAGELLLGYEGIWLDITRQTIAEKRLSAAAWKETLGMLTTGLAHDFCNIISGILALSESFLAQTDKNHPFHDGLNLIKQNSLQASQLVHRIINLHRGKVGEHGYHDLNQVVLELMDLVQKILPRRIQVATELAPGALPLYIDAVEFRQVVLNLALNAADAMPNRGKLIFRTSVHTAPQHLEHFQGRFPTLPCLCLSVQDDGCGIAARHLSSLFDPFFTTKPLRKGSGLGLYNARLFVEKHQGAISVDSEAGTGTTFHIWLPQADFTEAERQHGLDGGRRRSLLLVGETGLLASGTAEFLRTHDYYVVPAATPERAVELLSTEDSQMQGVMVLASPHDQGLSGLLAHVRAHHAGVKTILQIVGADREELPDRVRECAHLVLANDLSEEETLKQLDALFSAERAT